MSNRNSIYSLSFAAKPQRPLALLLMVLIHIGLIIALTGGLQAPSLPRLDPTQVRVIDPPITEKPKPIDVIPVAPWRPTHTITEPLVVTRTSDPIPPADIDIQPGDAADSRHTPDVAQTIVPPRSDSRYPLTQPAYPPASRRMGEEGTVELTLYITVDGRISDARIERSSGFARLDDAALREALRSWRLLPGRINDVPVAGWRRIAVTFHLK